MERHIAISLRVKRTCLFLRDEEKYDFNRIFQSLSMYDRKEFVKPLVKKKKKGSRRLISTNDTIRLHRVNELTSSLNNIRIVMDASNSCV